MTEKSLGIIVKHFCLDSLDESAANKDVLLFPPQSLNSVVIMNIFGKLIVNGLEDVYEEVKGLKSLEEMKKCLDYKTKSSSIKKYYFVDNSTKIKKKSKKGTQIVSISKESELTRLEETTTSSELEEAFISLYDCDPQAILDNGKLMSACSLIKLDEVYDFGIITCGDGRNKRYARTLMYEYLKKHSKDKLIRVIVPLDNIPMRNVVNSLGLTSEIEVLEIKLK